MINFLKAKGNHFVAFLLAFLLIFSVSVLPSLAQMNEDEVEVQIESAEEVEWEDWEAAIEELERSWEEMDDTGWEWEYDDEDDDYFFTTWDTTSAGGDDVEGVLAVMAIMLGIWGILMLPIYIYFALTLMTIAKNLKLRMLGLHGFQF